jgi:hypothetical protein
MRRTSSSVPYSRSRCTIYRPRRTAVILSPFGISHGREGFLRVRHVADVKLWARLRTQKRSDKGTDAGHVGDIASGASWTPLKITHPLRSSKVRKATSETPQSRLEISAGRRAFIKSSSHPRRSRLRPGRLVARPYIYAAPLLARMPASAAGRATAQASARRSSD